MIKNKTVKLLLFIVTLVSIYLAYNILLNRAEKEIHLIPEGYSGPVIILFDQPDGQKMLYDDKSRIYSIPEDGILKTQFSKSEGFYHDDDVMYFYVNIRGEKLMRIPFSSTNRLEKTVLQIYGLHSGILGDKHIRFVAYFIGSEFGRDENGKKIEEMIKRIEQH